MLMINPQHPHPALPAHLVWDRVEARTKSGRSIIVWPELQHEAAGRPQMPADGESHGVDTLMPLVYNELRRLASAKLRGERPEHTLQPTAVVHEAYLRLKHTGKRWGSETEFRRYAAPVIRHVLVDYARSRPPNTMVTVTCWEGVTADGQRQDVDVLALHEVLDRLEKHDPGLVRIVELRYFGGLTEEETAKAASIPLGTLKNKLTFGRTWLRRELTKAPKR